MTQLLWYFDAVRGELTRVPSGVSRGIRPLADPDRDVVIEFEPSDDLDVAPAWQSPAYPRPDEED